MVFLNVNKHVVSEVTVNLFGIKPDRDLRLPKYNHITV